MSFNSYYPIQPSIAQNRLNQMEQQFPQNYPPNNFGYQTPYNQMSMQQTQQMLKGRPVTSLDEAKASMIDLDGSVFIFPDYANGKIYTKQINLDGTASLNIYVRSNPQNANNVSQNAGIPDIVGNLQRRVEELEGIVFQLEKGGNQNVQSNADYELNDRENKSRTTNDVSAAR